MIAILCDSSDDVSLKPSRFADRRHHRSSKLVIEGRGGGEGGVGSVVDPRAESEERANPTQGRTWAGKQGCENLQKVSVTVGFRG